MGAAHLPTDPHDLDDALFCFAKEGLVAFDTEGRVARVNPAACEMLCVTENDLLGGDVDSPRGACSARRRRRRSSPQANDPSRSPSSGVPSLWSSWPGSTPSTTPTASSSARRSRCTTSRASARSADMKNEFVSTVSHELRTPLTSIKGYVDLILDGDAGEINEIQREFLGIVKENSDRLVELINEMLDISRIESGRVHLKVEPMSLQDSVEGAVDTFRAVLSQTGRSVDVNIEHGLPPVAADRDRVGQVLVNLISNALKYSPAGGLVAVGVAQRGRLREGLRERPGARHQRRGPRPDVHQVLPRGLRDDARDRRNRPRAFDLQDDHRAAGRPDRRRERARHGLDVLVHAPGRSRSRWCASRCWTGPDGPATGTILVVDRDDDVADLIGTYLARHGYDVVKAHTADEALVAALRYKPRAITLDVILDEGDGFDLLHRLKDSPDTADIPVVVLSIVCDEGRSCRMGAANYLEKPIDQSRLLSMIDDIVGVDLLARRAGGRRRARHRASCSRRRCAARDSRSPRPTTAPRRSSRSSSASPTSSSRTSRCRRWTATSSSSA